MDTWTVTSAIEKEKQRHVPKRRVLNGTYQHYSKIHKFVLKTGTHQKSSQEANKILQIMLKQRNP